MQAQRRRAVAQVIGEERERQLRRLGALVGPFEAVGRDRPQIVARVEPSVRTKSHEKIRLSFVPDRIHFFDAKTEAVIK